jgi:cysteine desulfurase/selenocysteine lyase
MREWNGGGDMILEVHKDKFTQNIIPYKFEAGTPNIEGTIGLSEAMKYISKIGFDKIEFGAFSSRSKPYYFL